MGLVQGAGRLPGQQLCVFLGVVPRWAFSLSLQRVSLTLLSSAVAQKVVALRKKQQLAIGPCKSLPNSPSHSAVSTASIPTVNINQVWSLPPPPDPVCCPCVARLQPCMQLWLAFHLACTIGLGLSCAPWGLSPCTPISIPALSAASAKKAQTGACVQTVTVVSWAASSRSCTQFL